MSLYADLKENETVYVNMPMRFAQYGKNGKKKHEANTMPSRRFVFARKFINICSTTEDRHCRTFRGHLHQVFGVSDI